MARVLRPLMIFAALFWVYLIPETLPGLELSTESSGISIGTLLKQGFNSWVFGAFVLGGFFAARGRGFLAALGYLLGAKAPAEDSKRRAAAGTLLGATRGLLWGSFALLLVADVQTYLRMFAPRERLGAEDFSDIQATMEIIHVGGALMLPFLVLVMLPGAASLGSGLASGRQWLRRVDAACLLGYAALALVPPLSLFIAQHGGAGVENSAVYWLPPSLDTITLPFLAWSLMVLAALASLAFMLRGEGQFKMPWGRQTFSIDLYLLATGALVSSTIRVATMQSIASSAGSANPDQLQSLGGRMLVSLALALGLIGLRRMINRSRATKLEPAME